MAEASATADADTKKLKELLYRVEAERLHLQQQAAGLADNKQQLTADVFKLQQQLESAHAALTDSQRQLHQLTTSRDRLQVQVKSAVTEYRANDIIAIGLRDHITRLQQELRDSQNVCSHQASEIATFADDMASLRTCKADLTQQLSQLQQQHHELQEQHTGTVQQLARAQQEAHDIQQRWVDQHGDQARQLQAVDGARQQAEDRVAVLTTQLEQEQQQLAQQHSRVAELEGELSHIRELVVLLGKAMGRLPGGQQLPSHDDPVWLQLGPLGGVSFALDTVIKHTREQHVRVRELQGEFDKMEDRVRAESAQKADLQSELYDARTMYAKAVAVREALEARTTRAEAEKAAAETSMQQARAQAAEDDSRLSSLQEQVMSLSQQVQLLQPLQPKLSTAEVERDTALHKLERLQEQYDQLQRQLQHATSREVGLQSEVDAYKLEHTQLLAANTQLMAQCTGLNREVQELEVSVREGSAAKGQLEEAKRKLQRTKTQLQAMTDRHVGTMSQLETAKDLIVSAPSSSSLPASRPTSAACTRGSRPSTAATATPTAGRRVRLPDSTSSSPTISPHSNGIGAAAQQQQQLQLQQGSGAPSKSLQGSAANAGTSAGPSSWAATEGGQPGERSGAAAAAYAAGAAAAAAAAGGGHGGTAHVAGVDHHHSQQQQKDADDIADQLQHSPSDDIDAMLRHRELERLAADQQQELDSLQHQVQQQEVQIARLEVQLLQQEAEHLQQLHSSEAAVSGQCLAAAGEAVQALQAALRDLQQALDGPAAAAAAADESASQIGSSSADATSGETTSSNDSGQDAGQQQQPQPKSWLREAAAEVLSGMQLVVERTQARAALVAARQNVGVQSDEALQSQWLAFLRSLPDAAVAQPLHLKAASEAILRIYMRGLSQLEGPGTGLGGLQRQLGGVLGPGGGAAVTVFDLLMAHYTPPAQQQQGQGRLLTRPYSAALWKDPQGPITRLLVSCRCLAPSSVKVALFCCLAGTHTPASSRSSTSPWGYTHWQQFLLLLHAAKQLTGGLWKSVLRDWAGASGALLPLQCVLDLLGNVYNVSSMAALEQQPAVLGGRQQLLDAAGSSSSGSGSRVASAAGEGPGAVVVPQGRPLTPLQQVHQQQQQQWLGTVAAALKEVVVDGPLGPASAVDFDDLLAMLMVQYDAGLLPPHPLMQPRRLTTGDLGNTTNAWGSAATEAAAGMLPRRTTLMSAGGGVAVPGLQSADSSELTGRNDWGMGTQPNSPGSMSSTVGGWNSRPTTGAAVSRIGTAAGVERGLSPTVQQQPGGSPMHLPRIRTPDSASRDAQRSNSSGGSGPAAQGNMQGLGSAASSRQQGIRKGVSLARVAFLEPDGMPRDKS